MARTDSRERLQMLRELLEREEASTQEDLREELERRDFDVNQSTISRDLRKLGAIKMTDADGVTTYRLPADPPPAGVVKGLADLIKSIEHNGAMIVISTDAGSAPLVARHIETLRYLVARARSLRLRHRSCRSIDISLPSRRHRFTPSGIKSVS